MKSLRTRDLVEQAVSDISSIVRFKAIKSFSETIDLNTSYDQYWRILTDRLQKERDGFVYGVLLANINLRESDNFESRRSSIEDLLRIIEAERGTLVKDSSFRDAYTDILLWALVGHGSVLAKEIMMSSFDHVEFCNTIVFKAFNKINPSIHGIDYKKDQPRLQRVIEVMHHYLFRIDLILSRQGYKDLDFTQVHIKNSFSILNQIILRSYFQLSNNNMTGGRRISMLVNESKREEFYFLIKPLYEKILDLSSKLNGTGLMTGSSAHHLTQALNLVLPYDVRFILKSVLQITRYAKAVNYSFDGMAIKEIVFLTERLLADHRYLLQEPDSFAALVELLDIYANAGWVDALALLWKLDEVFK